MSDSTHLAHDHSEIDQALADTFAALAEGDVEQSFAKLDFFWARLAVHIRAENTQLFPALTRVMEGPRSTAVADIEAARAAIVRLQEDHDFFMHEITALVKELRELLRGNRRDPAEVVKQVREQLTTVSQRLEAHNELEESQVYHWAGAWLDETKQKALSEKIQQELDRLPPRLRQKQ